jgi:hypothetical protein
LEPRKALLSLSVAVPYRAEQQRKPCSSESSTTLWVYGVGLLRMFFFMFFLPGCTADVASPVTMPLWIVIRVSLPRTWAVWRGFTLFHLITFTFVACLSFIERNRLTFSIATIVAVVTLVLCFTVPADRNTALSRNKGIVGIQILVALVGLGTILAYMLSLHNSLVP